MKPYEKERIDKLVDELVSEGYVVYLAESGSYGFYTNEDGSRLVDFSISLGVIDFSGNYVSNNPRECGNGWRIEDGTYHDMLYAYPPSWATRGYGWRYTTVKEQLAQYKSSKYKRVEVDNE